MRKIENILITLLIVLVVGTGATLIHHAGNRAEALTAGLKAVLGSGAQPGNLAVNTTQIAFGSVTSGSASVQTITWTNNGGMVITPTFALSGTNTDQFVYTSHVSTTLGPADTGTMEVKFAPTTAQSDSATISGNW